MLEQKGRRSDPSHVSGAAAIDARADRLCDGHLALYASMPNKTGEPAPAAMISDIIVVAGKAAVGIRSHFFQR